MGFTSRHLRNALERPPPPRTWSGVKSGALSPNEARAWRPPPAPYRSVLQPVPWLIRGNNAALVFAAIVLAGALALWALG